MTDIVIQGNTESPLQSTLNSALKSSMAYSISKNYPNLATHVIKISPNIQSSGDPVGKNLTFCIPKYGYIDGMVIESVLTGGDNSVVDDSNYGERIFSNISWNAHSKTICQQTPLSCRINGSHRGFSTASAHVTLVNPQASFASGVVTTIFTPFYTSFFEGPKTSFDATFAEQTEVVCTINSLLGMGGKVLSAGTFSLWLIYHTLESEAKEELTARNFKPSTPLTYLITDVSEELTTAVATATSTTVDLRSNNLVSKMAFGVRNLASNGVGAFKPITTYSMNVSGRDLRTSVPARLSDWLQGTKQKGYGLRRTRATNTMFMDNLNKPLCMYFGLEGDKTFNSGCASFKNLNSPTLTLVTAALAVTDQIQVNYFYYSLVSISSSNGDIERGLSV